MTTSQGIFITGTNTNVGKTWLSVHLIQALHQLQITVIPRKPVESGWPDDASKIQYTDAWQLQHAAQTQDTLSIVCPYHYTAALSPPRAANLEGQHLTLSQLIQACTYTPHSERDFLIVEGAGGFYSPIAEDGLNADLNQRLNLPVLLVAEDRLGCINEVLLCVETIQRRGQKLFGIVLNQKQATQKSITNTEDKMDNATDLRQLQKAPVFICKTNSGLSTFLKLARHCLEIS